MAFHRVALRAVWAVVLVVLVVLGGSAALPASFAAVLRTSSSGAGPIGQSRGLTACDITTTGRIVAVGDVHGAFDTYVAILREAQLIDSRRRWIGGNALLIQLGDVLDRGTESRQVLDLIRRLETEAPKAGGGVLFLLGNHEVMRMQGDFRDVHPDEYKAFLSRDAEPLRERLYEHLVAQGSATARAKGEKFDERDFRKKFLADIPLGSVEMQIAFSESGEYGPWLRGHEVMARVNGIAFVHGGPGVRAAAAGCAGTNARIRTEIKTVKLTDPDYADSLIWSPEGPLWHRGLVGGSPASTGEEVTAVLKALDASRIVVGHTVSPTKSIVAHHNGRVFQIDTGMLGGATYPGGVPSALEIQGGTFLAIYQGKREVVFPK